MKTKRRILVNDHLCWDDNRIHGNDYVEKHERFIVARIREKVVVGLV